MKGSQGVKFARVTVTNSLSFWDHKDSTVSVKTMRTRSQVSLSRGPMAVYWFSPTHLRCSKETFVWYSIHDSESPHSLPTESLARVQLVPRVRSSSCVSTSEKLLKVECIL